MVDGSVDEVVRMFGEFRRSRGVGGTRALPKCGSSSAPRTPMRAVVVVFLQQQWEESRRVNSRRDN
jgi:hypothetical protein